jgi:hypothetical protein
VLEQPFPSLTNSDVKASWLQAKAGGYSSATQASAVGMCRTFVRWAKAEKHPKEDLMEGISVPGRKRRGANPSCAPMRRAGSWRRPWRWHRPTRAPWRQRLCC